MVKLRAYLLALTLATGSALAISVHYQRRSELNGRESLFTRKEPYGRELLEEREPNFAIHFAKNMLKKVAHHDASNAGGNNNNPGGNNNNKRELNAEELFGREYDHVFFSSTRIANSLNAILYSKLGKTVEKHIHQHSLLRRRANVAGRVRAAASVLQNRAFEDDGYLSRRDLDAEQLLGREYDLEAREPPSMSSAFRAAQAGQNAAAKHQVGQRLGQQNTFQNRGFEDNEDLFRRVLEEERQYSLKKPSAIYSQAGHVPETRYNEGGKRRSSFENLFGRDLGTDLNLQDRYMPSLDAVTRHLDKASALSQQIQGIANTLTSRGFEDDKEPFRRDPDTEELFGREYDLVEAREPLLSTIVHNIEKADTVAHQTQGIVNTIKSRGFEDDILWTGI